MAVTTSKEATAVTPAPAAAAETPEATEAGSAAQAALTARIARATALAALTAVAPVRDMPAIQEFVLDQANQPIAVTQGGMPGYEVPIIPKPTAFTGLRYDWYPGGEPYRVIELVYPLLIDGRYATAHQGDVIVLDAEHAAQALQFRAVEAIPQ